MGLPPPPQHFLIHSDKALRYERPREVLNVLAACGSERRGSDPFKKLGE
jgi:hypothetical protein